MKIVAVLLLSMLFTGCAATHSWLGHNADPVTVSATNTSTRVMGTTTVIAPQGTFLVNRSGSTVTVIQTSRGK